MSRFISISTKTSTHKLPSAFTLKQVIGNRHPWCHCKLFSHTLQVCVCVCFNDTMCLHVFDMISMWQQKGEFFTLTWTPAWTAPQNCGDRLGPERVPRVFTCSIDVGVKDEKMCVNMTVAFHCDLSSLILPPGKLVSLRTVATACREVRKGKGKIWWAHYITHNAIFRPLQCVTQHSQTSHWSVTALPKQATNH